MIITAIHTGTPTEDQLYALCMSAHFLFLFYYLFIYLFIYLRKRESEGGEAEGEGQEDSTLTTEPHMELDFTNLR